MCTRQNEWTRVGTVASATANGDSALSVTERSWSTSILLTNCVTFISSEGINGIEVRFLMPTNNQTADLEIFAVRAGEVEGPLVDNNLTRITDLDLTCGLQAEINASDAVTGKLYVDTIAATNTWSNSVTVVDSAADRIARIKFDLCGYRGILFHGYGTFQADCIVEIAGF